MAQQQAKTILVTGSTDGIGLLTAKNLLSLGHNVLLHGRSKTKVDRVVQELKGGASSVGKVTDTFVADLSKLDQVEQMATEIRKRHSKLDVLLNNAGVFKVSSSLSPIVDGLDIRFTVNAIAPYLLTKHLLPLLSKSGRVVNVSSAAQATPDLDALSGKYQIPDDFSAYAQSKLAIVMWNNAMAKATAGRTTFLSINPGSYLGTKMVKEGFGMANGNDVQIGADILIQAALGQGEFANAAAVSGTYYDNDSQRFASPRPAALDPKKCDSIVATLEEILASKGISSSPVVNNKDHESATTTPANKEEL